MEEEGFHHMVHIQCPHQPVGILQNNYVGLEDHKVGCFTQTSERTILTYR